MKKILTLLSVICSLTLQAQPFWTENFGTTGTAVTGTVVSSYSGTGGTWGLTSTGTEGGARNEWYVSCEEAGHTTGGCGSTCGSSGDLGPSLHVGSTLLGDMGAAYFTGTVPNAATDRRAESPTINCTGRYTITLQFYYTMGGQASTDYATVWYYDGTTWSLLSSPPMTPAICPGGQGYWDHYTVALPTSANNNPNVKIGFRWVNNNDGIGNDPSFAVDSVSMWAASSTGAPTPSFTTIPSATVCQDSCITFTNTSTGAVDSFTWTISGAIMVSTPHVSPVTICFAPAGVFTVTLTDYKSGTSYPVSHVVTINPAPAAISGSHLVCVGDTDPLSSATAGGTWSSSNTSIATVGTSGVVSGVATGTATITYSLSTGCIAVYTVTVTPLPCTTGINDADAPGRVWTTSASGNIIDLYTAAGPNEAVNISVYDPAGRKVAGGLWSQGRHHEQVDCSACAPGVYVIRITGAHTAQVIKWLKE